MELLKNAIAEKKVDDDYIAEAYYEYVEANPRASPFRFATQATIALKGYDTPYTFDKVLEVLKNRGIISSTNPTESEASDNTTRRHRLFEKRMTAAEAVAKATEVIKDEIATEVATKAKAATSEDTTTTEVSEADIEKARQRIEKAKKANPRSYNFALNARRRERAIGSAVAERQLSRMKALNKAGYVEALAERKVLDEIIDNESASSSSSTAQSSFRHFGAASDNVPPFIRKMRERRQQMLKEQQQQSRVEEVKEEETTPIATGTTTSEEK